jgi:hypothetical protein
VRIRVTTQAAFTVGLALAVLTTCSNYVFTLHLRMATPTRPAAFHIDSADAQQWADPQVLITAADHLYFLNNGPASSSALYQSRGAVLGAGRRAEWTSRQSGSSQIRGRNDVVCRPFTFLERSFKIPSCRMPRNCSFGA